MTDTEKITIKLIEYGEMPVEVDRAEYEAAKAADKLDHLLDHDASDMETDTTVIEPDGTRFNLYGYDEVYPDLRGELEKLLAQFERTLGEYVTADMKDCADLMAAVTLDIRRVLDGAQ